MLKVVVGCGLSGSGSGSDVRHCHCLCGRASSTQNLIYQAILDGFQTVSGMYVDILGLRSDQCGLGPGQCVKGLFFPSGHLPSSSSSPSQARRQQLMT